MKIQRARMGALYFVFKKSASFLVVSWRPRYIRWFPANVEDR